MANVLKSSKRTAVVAALCEGNSINSTVRMTGVAKTTILRLLVDLGDACASYQDKMLRNLDCQRLQVDEIWAFCYAKAKNVPADKRGTFGFGDVWTFCAIDADTKLVPSFLVGSRDSGCATELMQDLAGRLRGRAQITTDGHDMYPIAVEDAFGGNVDFYQLVKFYANAPSGPETRYSPADCTGCSKRPIVGDPAERHISTSFIERQNLTVRMSIRRFTRLTNAFSKKIENHAAHVAIHFFFYNFCRPHATLGGQTPAQAAGVDSRRWSIADLVGLLDNPKD